MDVLTLARLFYTPLDFIQLKDRFKRKIGINYKLGLIDNDEISLYYVSNVYTKNGLDGVPLCQIKIRNTTQIDGRTKIHFSIANFYLLAISFMPIAFMLILHFGEAPLPFYYASILYPLLYLVLQFYLIIQAERFAIDLKKIEIESLKVD